MTGGVDRFNNAASSKSRTVVGGLNDTGISSTTLTNLTASSDALGKPIPRTFGHVVIGGNLVWASPYYIITRGFTQETQYWTDTDYHDYDHLDTSTLNGTRVTLVEKSEYGIDLCYSFGFEGQHESRRKVSKFKINGAVVYDGATGYVMPGIGFDIREGQDTDIPAAMAKYELSGKFFYHGQTLIVLQQFRTADWGGALPQSVEVEFVAETALGTSETKNLEIDFSAGASYPGILNSFIEPDYRRMYFYNPGLGSAGTLLVYNMDTGDLIEEILCHGPAASDLKSGGGNYLNASGSCMTGDLRCFVFAKDGYNAGMFIDLTTAFIGYTGSANCNGFVCISANASTAYIVGTDLFDFGRQNITLVRDLSTGVVQAQGFTKGPMMPIGATWWDDGHGYGDGFACAIKGQTLILFNSTGAAIGVGLAQEHIERGATYRSVIAYKGGAVCLVGTGTNATSCYVIAYNPDGSVRAQKPVGSNLPTIRYEQHAGSMAAPSDRYYATCYFNTGIYTDLVTLNVTVYAIPFEFDFGFDKITNKLFGKIVGDSVIAQSGPTLLDSKIKIIDLIRDLYETAGIYQRNQVIGSPDLLDSIAGAILITNIDVIAFVDQLCQLYRIQKTETAEGIYFYKTRSIQLGIKVAATIDVSELAIDLTDNDDPTPIQSERKSEDTQPSAITLKYIDSDLAYKENSVSWRRVDTTQANGQELQIALPLVMTADEALTLVQQAVVDSTASVFTHRFRLPPRLSAFLISGDIITIVDGAYRTTVDIELLDINGDCSASVEATSIGQVNVANIAVPPLNSLIANPTQGTTPLSVGYVIDSPTLVDTDKPEAGKIVVYESITSDQLSESYAGGYFGRRLEGGEWGSLPTFVNNSQTIVFRAKSVLTNKRWTVDNDDLTIQRISGKLPPNKTLTGLQTDRLANLAWYGKPGRWELIKFCSAQGGKLSGGIMRGLRGTEIYCGKHEMDDLVICASVNVVNETRSSETIGIPEEWKPVSVGRPFNAAASLPLITLSGNSARPFAPVPVLGQRQPSGDLVLTWARRDRGGSAWGNVALPVSDPLKFRVRIMSADGTTVVREWIIEAETVTYSAADRATDGMAGATVKVQIAQLSADNNVGAGFSETVTVNG